MTTVTKEKLTLKDILLDPEDQAARSKLGKALCQAMTAMAAKPAYKNLLNAPLIEELMKQEALADLVTDANIQTLLTAVKEVCGIPDIQVDDKDLAAVGDVEAEAAEAFAVGDRVRFVDPDQGPLDGVVEVYRQGWLRVLANGAYYNVKETAEGLSRLTVLEASAPAKPAPTPPPAPTEAPSAPGLPVATGGPVLDELRLKASKLRGSPNGVYVVLIDVPPGQDVFCRRKRATVREHLEGNETVIEILGNLGGEEILPSTTILLRCKDEGEAEPAKPKAEKAKAAMVVTKETGVTTIEEPFIIDPPPEPAEGPQTAPLFPEARVETPSPAGKTITLAQAIQALAGVRAEIDRLYEERKLMSRRIEDQNIQLDRIKAENTHLKSAGSAIEVDPTLAAFISQFS